MFSCCQSSPKHEQKKKTTKKTRGGGVIVASVCRVVEYRQSSARPHQIAAACQVFYSPKMNGLDEPGMTPQTFLYGKSIFRVFLPLVAVFLLSACLSDVSEQENGVNPARPKL